MTTAESKTTAEKSNNDVSTFLSDLNSAIDFRSSPKSGRRDAINRFYYTIGSTNILLEENLNVENISTFSINKIPHCKDWYEGIVSVRGSIMPVINMNKYLHKKIDIGKSTNKKTKSNFLLLDHAEHNPIIFLIDKLPTMVNIKHFSSKIAPNNSPDWYKNIFYGDDNSIIEIDHNELLNQLIQEQ